MLQKHLNSDPPSIFQLRSHVTIAVFLGGEWGVIDFTWGGRAVCMFLCVVGIGLYAIPVGSLFDSFGAILGMGGDDEEGDEEEN